MPWYSYVSYFFAGAFLINAVPHLVAGVSGRPFQTPFARPSGVGLSSSRANVLWGFANLLMAYVLTFRVVPLDPRDVASISALGLGGFALALAISQTFGRLHGGVMPNQPK